MNGVTPPEASRALFWAVVMIGFLAAAVALFAQTARSVALEEAMRAQTALTVRVRSPEDPAAVERVAAALRNAPGLVRVEAMSAERAGALLEQFGMEGLGAEDLAGLRLIEAERDLAGGFDPGFPSRLEATLAEAGFDVEVEGAGPAAAAGFANARRIGQFGLAATLGVAFVAGCGVALIARGRAFAARETVALLADLGATKSQAAQPFGEEAGGSAFAAGVIGALAAAALAIVILSQVPPGRTLFGVFASLGPLDLAPLAATPLLAALCAALGARSGAAAAYALSGRGG